MFQNIQPQMFLISMLVLIISLTIHEMAHALSARSAGDDTAERAGRISINPLDHLDPVGTIMMIVSSLSGFGIGWAKPVPVNPSKFRHPRLDNLKVSLWGPLSNFLIAVVACLALRFFGRSMGDIDATIVFAFAIINISLMLFNLLPIAPLDGSHIMSSLLPVDLARSYDMFMSRFGFMLLLLIIFVSPGALRVMIGMPARFLIEFFTGGKL